MRKTYAILAIFFILGAIAPGLGRAQVGLPSGYTVLPYVDDGTANDTIIQLNNLVIQGTSGTRPGIIYASQSASISCTKFYSVSGAGGIAYPCPELQPRTLYQIRVDSDTVLLTRSRARTGFENFAVGDRINVFGFLDPNSNFVQALIVRDLDKPSYGGGGGGGSGYIQINNVQVLSEPSGSTFFVLSRSYGCVSYGYGGTASGAAIACPLGMDASAGAANQSAGFSSAYYPGYGKIYRIEAGGAQVLDRYRSPIAISAIDPGHYVNIYGYYNRDTATVQASIVRDLNLPGGGPITPPIPPTPPPGTGRSSLTVSVVDNSIQCFTTPCGLVDNVTVYIQKAGGAGFVGVTTNGQVTFRDLDPGTYSIQLYQSGKQTTTQSVTLGSGETRSMTVYINGSGGGTTGSINVTSPNGGETYQTGSSMPLSWTGTPPTGSFSAGTQYDVYIVRKTISGDMVGNVQYTVAKNVFVDFGRTSYTYNWSVGQNQEGMTMPAGGNYYARVCYAGTYTCDESNGPFSINSGGYYGQPYITGLLPSSGYPGTSVTISGSGFAGQNTVHFEMSGTDTAYLPNIYSNGSSMTFTAPGYSSYACYYSQYRCMLASKQLAPGVYQVWVENASGVSNKYSFVLYSYSYFTP